MEKTKTVEEKITLYALIMFAVLLLLIIYTFFTTEPNKTTTVTASQEIAEKSSETAQVTTASPAIIKVAQQVTPTTETKPLATALLDTIRKTDEKTEMKPDEYKIPTSKKKKLTELLPQELRNSIQASLPSADEVKAMNPNERVQFKETQKKLAVILRDIGHTEAENQQLQRSLDKAEIKKQQLNEQLKK